jgi:hypothetical protein
MSYDPFLATPAFGGSANAACRHTIDLGSLSAMSLQDNPPCSSQVQGLRAYSNTQQGSNFGTFSSNQPTGMQVTQEQLLELSQVAAAAPGPSSFSPPGVQLTQTSAVGSSSTAALNDELAARVVLLQQQLQELQQQEQLLHQREMQLQLQLLQGDSLLTAAPPNTLLDGSFDAGCVSGSGNAYLSPKVQQNLQPGWSAPALSQQLMLQQQQQQQQQQQLALQSQLYAPIGQAMVQPPAWPEPEIVPESGIGSPMYQQQQQQQQSYAQGAFIQIPPDAMSAGIAAAAAAAARSPINDYTSGSWSGPVGATPLAAQAAAAAAAAAVATAAGTTGVAADTARMQAAYGGRQSLDLAAAVAAGPVTISARQPQLQGGSCSMQQPPDCMNATTNAPAVEGVQPSSQSFSYSSGSYIVRSAAGNAAAGQRPLGFGQPPVNGSQPFTNPAATIPCTPEQLASFVEEQHYYYQRANFEGPQASAQQRACIGGYTTAPRGRRSSAGATACSRRSSFDSGSFSGSRGLVAGAGRDRSCSNKMAAANATAVAAAAAAQQALRSPSGVCKDVQSSQPPAAGATNSSNAAAGNQQHPDLRSAAAAAGTAAGQAHATKPSGNAASGSAASAGQAIEPAGSCSSKSQQLARAAAPKWAVGSFWHPLAPLTRLGSKKGSSKGTGVFLPGGTEHLA